MIHLQSYNPQWPQWFEREKVKLFSVLGPIVGSIEHIGSTAIPGIYAKPIIDILVGVHDLSDITDEQIQGLEQIGYRYVPEFEQYVPDRRFLYKTNSSERTHQLHIVNQNSAWWHRHLLFRDYLKYHPQCARIYESEKLALARQYADNGLYSEAKTEVCQRLEKTAFYDFAFHRPFMETDRMMGYIPQMVCLGNYQAMFQDPEFANQYGAEVSDDYIREMLARDITCWDRYQMGPMAWFDKTGHQFVARAGIKPMTIDGQCEIELTYALKKTYWVKGLATEIGRELLNKAFQQWGVSNIVCFARPDHDRSLKVVRKLGFEYEKSFEQNGLTYWLYRLLET